MTMKQTYTQQIRELAYAACLTAAYVLTGCSSAPLDVAWNPQPKADIRVVAGNRNSTLDARLAANTPLSIGSYPVGVFMRDRLTMSYADRAQRDHVERLNNFSITDLNYGGAFKVLVGGRSTSILDMEHTHDSGGRIDLRLGCQYNARIETPYGDFRIFASPTAIVNPYLPKENPQGEFIGTIAYDFSPLYLELETVTRFNRQGIQQATQRFQGFLDLGSTLGIPGLSIGPQVELMETRTDRDPVVNAGGVVRWNW